MDFSFAVGIFMARGQEICRDVLDPLGCNPLLCQKQCLKKHYGGVGECWLSHETNHNHCVCSFICSKT